MPEKLKITGYSDADGTKATGKEFIAQINPSNISISHTFDFTPKNNSKAAPSKESESKEEAQELSFSLIMDGTGVVDTTDNVEKQIQKLKEACYYYIGEEHAFTYCKIFWHKDLLDYDNISFGGRLKSMSIDYKLFDSSGIPLRAEVKLAFVGTISDKTIKKALDEQSPDLTHIITIRTGDNLPMLCKKIYGNPQLYTEIARINNIVNFRSLEPGSELIFPPIK